MKNPASLSRIPMILTGFMILSFSQAQIQISTGPEITPVDMVESILGEGIIYDNVTFQGANIARGLFSNADSTGLGINKGVFLTSRDGNLIPWPNNSASAGMNNYLPGHPFLNTLTTSTTYDASVLEFDFYPEFDTLQIRYVFGSEEYYEWVNTTFNDVFGIAVTGPNPAGGYYIDKNIATLPDTSDTPVSINTVNGTINSEYFWDNTNGIYLQYDGFTTVLTAWLLVVPCETYHIKLGVADAGDAIFDSGIFFEENSITALRIEQQTNLIPPGLTENMVEGHVGADVIFKRPADVLTPFMLYFESLGQIEPIAYPAGDLLEDLPSSLFFENGVDSLVLHIEAVSDGLIEGDESLILVTEYTLGCNIVKHDTLILLVEDYFNMNDSITPDQLVCSGQTALAGVAVYNGYPPYSFQWEPGGDTTGSIIVNPTETTTYTVTVTDHLSDTLVDSTTVTVAPDHLN